MKYEFAVVGSRPVGRQVAILLSIRSGKDTGHAFAMAGRNSIGQLYTFGMGHDKYPDLYDSLRTAVKQYMAKQLGEN